MSKWVSVASCVAFACASSTTNAPIAERTVETPPSASARGAVTPAATDAHVELSVRKSSHFLGENVLVDFCFVNGTDAPVKIDVGGDYRGSSRSLRFKLDARDSHGTVMPDPDPEKFNMGGLGYSPEIAPSEKWCQSLQLMRYARIDAPGTYAITATHDLGWPAGKAPTGTTTVTFEMPDAASAERVVTAMEALPANANGTAGKVSIAYQDFSSMRYDVYTAPLAKRAQLGKAYAIEGLAEIPTTNATRALVALLGHASKEIAHAAAQALAMRLPDPALTGQLGSRNPFDNDMSAQRKYLSSRAWDPAFADDVRTAARARLASPEVRDVKDGAFMLEAVGTNADAPDLIKALDAAIDRTRTESAEKDIYPVPRGACQELLRAADVLAARGYKPNASPKTPGEIAIWLVALPRATPLPVGWEGELAQAMKHPIAYVRQLALDHTPAHHVTPALVAMITTNLAHADADVVVSAAKLAEREGVTSVAPNVVAAMSKQTGLRLNIVSNAARALGARFARAKALVARLSEKTAFDEVLGELTDLLDAHGRSTNGETTDVARALLPARWKTFVEAHRADIEAGRKVALTDASVTRDLVPPNWKLTRADGTEWP